MVCKFKVTVTLKLLASLALADRLFAIFARTVFGFFAHEVSANPLGLGAGVVFFIKLGKICHVGHPIAKAPLATLAVFFGVAPMKVGKLHLFELIVAVKYQNNCYN